MSVPANLMQQLGGPPPPMMGPEGYGGGEEEQDPLMVLQECIQALPGLINTLPDPRDTQDAVKALLILTGIQTRLMGGNAPAAA